MLFEDTFYTYSDVRVKDLLMQISFKGRDKTQKN